MVEEKVIEVIRDWLGIEETQVISLTDTLVEDLGADDIDISALAIDLEEEFGIEIPDEVIEKFTTVGDVVDCIKTRCK